jgi:hypothetical protein
MDDIEGNYIQNFLGKRVASGPFIRHKHRWEYKIETDFQEAWESTD